MKAQQRSSGAAGSRGGGHERDAWSRQIPTGTGGPMARRKSAMHRLLDDADPVAIARRGIAGDQSTLGYRPIGGAIVAAGAVAEPH